MTCDYYGDTSSAAGGLKYGAYGRFGTSFFGEPLNPAAGETPDALYLRLQAARDEFYSNCRECGDRETYEAIQQNLDIIRIHAHLRLGQADSALAHWDNTYPQWNFSSRCTDLYLAALRLKYGTDSTLAALLNISDLGQRDSIALYGRWLRWAPMRELEYMTYGDTIAWERYVRATLARIEAEGV